MRYLTLKDISQLHYWLVEEYGGSHGVRQADRIEAVIAAPRQAAFGIEQYEGVFCKAAVYARNLIADHPFVDGNKRTGITCAAVFLERNGYELTALPKDLEDFAVAIATDHPSVEQIAEWFAAHAHAR